MTLCGSWLPWPSRVVVSTFYSNFSIWAALDWFCMTYVQWRYWRICSLLSHLNLSMTLAAMAPRKQYTALLWKLIPVFLFLRISREFNSLIFPSSLAAFLPVLFLTLGSVVFVLEIYLLHSWLFTTLRSNTKKQYTCKMTKSSLFMQCYNAL